MAPPYYRALMEIKHIDIANTNTLKIKHNLLYIAGYVYLMHFSTSVYTHGGAIFSCSIEQLCLLSLHSTQNQKIYGQSYLVWDKIMFV